MNLNYLDESGNHQGGIHTGDSGGSAIRLDPSSGKKCLGGVLSASEHAATVHRTSDGRPTIGGTKAYYATNVAFLGREATKIGGRSPISSVLSAR